MNGISMYDNFVFRLPFRGRDAVVQVFNPSESLNYVGRKNGCIMLRLKNTCSSMNTLMNHEI